MLMDSLDKFIMIAIMWLFIFFVVSDAIGYLRGRGIRKMKGKRLNEERICGECFWYEDISNEAGTCNEEKNDRKRVPVIVKYDDDGCWNWKEDE